MQIANPIYDCVFKYLLDDNRIAKVFISAIIGEEIEELSLAPTEINTTINDKNGKSTKRINQPVYVSVYRIDFAAKIKTADGGHKLVLIEIQKASDESDIMRFRRYLGQNYASKNNFYIDENKNEKAYSILPIYILGEKLEGFNERMIHIKRSYIDNLTKSKLNKKSEFIESLTHDSFIVQLSADTKGKHPRQSDLEILLDIFNQDNATNNKHILNINEEELPEKYKMILRRLHAAVSEKSIKDAMDIEDDLIESMKKKERRADEYMKIAKEETMRADNEKHLREQVAHNSAKLMKQAGISIDEIASATGLDIDEIEKL